MFYAHVSITEPYDIRGREQLDAEREAQLKVARAKEALDFKQLMADVRFRRFIRTLLANTGVFHSCITGNNLDTHVRLGERNVGLRYLAMLEEYTPEMFAKLITEEVK